jgi:hypothetical protein
MISEASFSAIIISMTIKGSYFAYERKSNCYISYQNFLDSFDKPYVKRKKATKNAQVTFETLLGLTHFNLRKFKII